VLAHRPQHVVLDVDAVDVMLELDQRVAVVGLFVVARDFLTPGGRKASGSIRCRIC
jgi:hypothetical protein